MSNWNPQMQAQQVQQNQCNSSSTVSLPYLQNAGLVPVDALRIRQVANGFVVTTAKGEEHVCSDIDTLGPLVQSILVASKLST